MSALLDNGLSILGYLAILVASLALSWVLVPFAIRLATRRQILDHPGGYKQQEAPVPYLGGLAMLLAFSVAVIAAALVRPPTAGFTELLVIMALASALSIVGLIDDLRGLGITVRLAAMTAAGIALWFGGTGVLLFGNPWVDGAITVLWVVGITNAMNLLDNMDGLSAGVAAIAAVTFFGVAALNGQFLVAALSIALAGCAMGFLRHNRYPARIYMGDAGSLFLGFLLAALGIRLRLDAGPPIAVFVPLIVLSIPIFDTALVVVSRMADRVNPFQGGADHASHRLVRLGLRVPVAVGLIYGAAAGSAWLAIAMSRQTDLVAAWLLVTLWITLASVSCVLLVRASSSGPARTGPPRRRETGTCQTAESSGAAWHPHQNRSREDKSGHQSLAHSDSSRLQGR
jgi:UDP-GlcNAc:undecaprenyl-phosphate/decaprenyl-phosphate GlcNAc-1-phosphate transferase